MTRLILFSLLITVATAQAQEDTAATMRSWSQGPLTWEDFQGRPYVDDTARSLLVYTIGLRDTFYFHEGQAYFAQYAFNQVMPEESWAQKWARSENDLRFNQTRLDIIEWTTRQLQKQVLTLPDPLLEDSLLDATFKTCEQQLSNLHFATRQGTDAARLEAWATRWADSLRQPLPDSIPDIQFATLGSFLHLGVGTAWFNQSLGDHIRPVVTFDIGGGFSFRKTSLSIDGAIGGTRTTEPIISSRRNWPDSWSLVYGEFGCSVAQVLWENHRHRIAPFAGISGSVMDASPSAEEERPEDLGDASLDGFGWHAGLIYDLKMLPQFDLRPDYTWYTSGPVRSHMALTLRLKSYITHHNYALLEGTMIHIGLQIGLISRNVALRTH